MEYSYILLNKIETTKSTAELTSFLIDIAKLDDIGTLNKKTLINRLRPKMKEFKLTDQVWPKYAFRDALARVVKETTTCTVRKYKDTIQQNYKSMAKEVVCTNDASTLPSLLFSICSTLRNDDDEATFKALVLLRKFSANPDESLLPRILEIMVDNPTCLQLVTNCLENKNTHIQFESLWILTNIASGDSHENFLATQLTTLPDENSATGKSNIDLVCRLLQTTSSNEVVEQCIWYLANLVGGGAEIKDMILHTNGICNSVSKIVSQRKTNHASESLLKTCAWAISNFCRSSTNTSEGTPNFEIVRVYLPILNDIVMDTTCSDSIKSDCLYALSYLSRGDNERIQAVVDSVDLENIVNLLDSSNLKDIVSPVLSMLGNIVSGTALQTQYVLISGFLPKLYLNMNDWTKAMNKEAVWAISNICASTDPTHVRRILECDDFLETKILGMLTGQNNKSNTKIRAEATWALSNLLDMCNKTHDVFDGVEEIVERGGIPALLCAISSTSTATGVRVALEGFGSIIRNGNTRMSIEGGSHPYLYDDEHGYSLHEKILEVCSNCKFLTYALDEECEEAKNNLMHLFDSI